MEVLQFEYLFMLLFTFVIGTVIGSGLNVFVHRIPREEGLWAAIRGCWSPPSHCPRCLQRIAWYDNVPILGWLWLRGRCRNCRGWISPRYPLVELTTGLLFALLYLCEIPLEWQPSGGSLRHPYGPASLYSPALGLVHVRYALHLVLLCALLVATLIDIDLRIIPDAVTLPALATAWVVQGVTGTVFLVPVVYQTPEMARLFAGFALPFAGSPTDDSWWARWARFEGFPAWVLEHPHWHGLAVAAAGMLLGGGVIWGVRLVGGWVLKREAMGFGDVVLMAMIGSFLGWQATLAVFLLAPLLAVAGTLLPALFWKTRTIPYGPYLSLATLLVLLGFRRFWSGLEEGLLALGPTLPVAAAVMLLLLAALLQIWGRIKQALGWVEPEEPGWIVEWLPADQLTYQAMENSDDRQGQWSTSRWPGETAGRGQGAFEAWRYPGGRGWGR